MEQGAQYSHSSHVSEGRNARERQTTSKNINHSTCCRTERAQESGHTCAFSRIRAWSREREGMAFWISSKSRPYFTSDSKKTVFSAGVQFCSSAGQGQETAHTHYMSIQENDRNILVFAGKHPNPDSCLISTLGNHVPPSALSVRACTHHTWLRGGRHRVRHKRARTSGQGSTRPTHRRAHTRKFRNALGHNGRNAHARARMNTRTHLFRGALGMALPCASLVVRRGPIAAPGLVPGRHGVAEVILVLCTYRWCVSVCVCVCVCVCV